MQKPISISLHACALTDLTKLKTPALLVICAETPSEAELGKPLVAALTSLKREQNFPHADGTAVLIHKPAGLACERLVVVRGQDSDARSQLRYSLTGLKAVRAAGVAEVSVVLTDVSRLSLTVRAFEEASYRYETTKKHDDPLKLNALQLVVSSAHKNKASQLLPQAEALAHGLRLTKSLADLPGNYCTPSHLGKTAEQLGRTHKFKVSVLERKQIEALRMGAFLSVTNGSAEPPRFIILEYSGASKKEAPHVLVGKGITFDSGGISLKPGAGMDEMKYDMCGAATVLGLFEALGRLKPAINVVGLIPTCENMPSGKATKPGDVVTTMSGQTVEILNTDAEGRLILCDALTYSERYKPQSVVDIATLTGACVVALGHVNTGLFSAHDDLTQALLDSAKTAADPTWRLPLEPEYAEGLKSRFADVANVAGREGGAITAATYLHRFTKNLRWAHLDIAGTAWNSSGPNKGATGRPVPMLWDYLLSQVGKTTTSRK